MIKKLLMEGCEKQVILPVADLGNNGLRTVCHNDDGRTVFLEIAGHNVTKYTDKWYFKFGDNFGIVRKYFYIDTDDPYMDVEKMAAENTDKKIIFAWTMQGVINLLKAFNITVEEIEVDNSGKYKVFNDDGTYNYGDGENNGD